MASRNPKSEIRNPKLTRLVRHLLAWFSQNARDLPWRRTRDPYAILVSEIMLQQTQVKTVIPYWERWMHELPTIEAVAKASPDRIHKLWEGLGYYTRARNLQKAAKQIVANCRRRGNESLTKIRNPKSEIRNKSGTPYAFARLRRDRHVVSCKFPDNFRDVLALPGIGRYTAGAICSIAFNQPTPILDGNVIRVLTRIFDIAENPKEKETNARLWKLAEDLVRLAKVQRWGEPTGKPAREDARPTKNGNCSQLNQSLMELGAVVCTPRTPKCGTCPAQTLCVAFQEDKIEQLPNLGKRNATTARHFAAFVVEQNGHFLVRQRPAGVVNAHLWEFPNVEIGAQLSEPQFTRLRNINGAPPTTNSIRTCRGSEDPRSKLLADVARQALGFEPEGLQPFGIIKHSITRYRITLEAFTARWENVPPKNGNGWKTPAQLQRLAFSSAHKRILSQLVAGQELPRRRHIVRNR